MCVINDGTITVTLAIYVGSGICMTTRGSKPGWKFQNISSVIWMYDLVIPRNPLRLRRNAMNDSVPGQQISGYVPGIRGIPIREGSGHRRVPLVTAQVLRSYPRSDCPADRLALRILLRSGRPLI